MLHRPAAIARPGHVEAVDLAVACGLTLYPFQVEALALAMAEREDGHWAADVFDWLVSRQNGKNETALVRELFGLVLAGETIVHSAHHFKTTMRSYKRLKRLIYANPDVSSMVTDQHASSASGYDFEFSTGGNITFLARGSAGGGRGFDAIDLLILDEAQELTDEMIGDVMPIVSAVPNHQIWQFGTAPELKQEFWQRKRSRGRRGADPRTAYMEISAEPDADIEDRSLWPQANPAMIYGELTVETLEGLRGNMSEETFAREVLSISPELDDTGALPGWAHICDPDATAAPDVLTIDCNPERTAAGIVAADKARNIEVIDYRPGVGWLVDRIVELSRTYRAPVAIDGSGPAAAFIPELERAHVRVVAVPAVEMPRACGHLYDSVVNQTVTVRTNTNLNGAVAAAARRDVGDAWAWGRKSSKYDISLLVAATIGHWVAVAHTRPRVYSMARLLEETDGNDR